MSSEKLRKGKLENHEWEQLNVKVGDLEKAPLFIDDTPSLSIFDLRAKARRLSSQHGIKLIIVDYLQLMTAGSSNKTGNREQEISTISRNLKALAKELDVPVIALSQLSRAVETRGGTKRPLLSDLRESGAIEQDADIVSFIYRPEYYGIDEWDDEQRTSSLGQAEFIVAKHRNGGLDNIRLKFIGHLGKFDNLEDFDSPYEFPSKMNETIAPSSFDAPFDRVIHYDLAKPPLTVEYRRNIRLPLHDNRRFGVDLTLFNGADILRDANHAMRVVPNGIGIGQQTRDDIGRGRLSTRSGKYLRAYPTQIV